MLIFKIYVFLFPLALYSWSCLRRKPSYFRALLCAFAFGWVIGWNVYYQVFLNFILAALLVQAFLRNELPKPLLFFLLGMTLFFEMPFAHHYLQLEALMGSLKVPTAEYTFYSASLLSPIAHADSTSFLQSFLPFYPKVHLSIENVGFLGITWTVLTFLSLRNSKARLFSLAAFFFFWAALGPHFGLMSILKFFPGFHGTRSIGRIQVLVVLFSLAGMLLYLETLKPRLQTALLIFILLELLPSELSKHAPMMSQLYDPKMTEFELELSKIPQTQALLILPDVKPEFQLSLSRTNHSLLEGYSGRTPFNAHLLNQLSRDGVTSNNLKQKLVFSGANSIISIDEPLSEQFKRFSFLTWQGCYSHFKFHPCIFSPKWSHSEDLRRLALPSLYLDRDTHWEYPPMEKGQRSILKADRGGVLNYEAAGKCWIEENIYFRGLRLWKNKQALSAFGFKAAEWHAGDDLLEQESRQLIFRLPKNIRPRKIYSILCHSS